MSILITDWGNFDEVLPVAMKYQVGMELLEFAVPENLENNTSMIEELQKEVSAIPVLGLHGPFTDLVPASRDPLVRHVTRTRFQQGYDLARTLGASHYILHSGYIPKTYPREVWLQNSLDFWLGFLADKPGVDMIHIENVYEDDYSTLQELVDRVNQELQGEWLSICVDIGHVHANSSKTLPDWIKGLGNRIHYTHIHNNNGVLDDHWKLDKGEINVDEVLNLLSKYAPSAHWTIETSVEDLEPSLVWLHDRGYL